MPAFQDLTGQRFGRLVVLERAQNHVSESGRPRTMWLCQCDCGNLCTVCAVELKNGDTKSCGCYMRERIGNTHRKHGESNTPIYRLWQGIKNRCYNLNEPAYVNYGGRGITMCDEWRDSYLAFRDWAFANGYEPNKGLSIDRIDVNGNYEPSNCRFVTRDAQANNKRSNVMLTYDGRTQTLAQWAAQVGMPYGRLHARISKLGWDAEKAITTPFVEWIDRRNKNLTQQRT